MFSTMPICGSFFRKKNVDFLSVGFANSWKGKNALGSNQPVPFAGGLDRAAAS